MDRQWNGMEWNGIDIDENKDDSMMWSKMDPYADNNENKPA